MGRQPGSVVKRQSKRSVRVLAWTAMRNFGQRRDVFTIDDLAFVIYDAGCSRPKQSNLRRYVKALADAGFINCIGRTADQEKRYRMSRDSGPAAPIMREIGTVYDPNTATEYQRESEA